MLSLSYIFRKIRFFNEKTHLIEFIELIWEIENRVVVSTTTYKE